MSVDYLILTEKKSAFDNFKNALGGVEGTFNGHSYRLTHAQGHLMEFANPEDQVKADLKKRYQSWDLDTMPWNIDDFNWRLVPIKTSRRVLNKIQSDSNDAKAIVIATDNDASGEGELLAWEIINAIGWHGPVYREYHDDESAPAIKKALQQLKDVSNQQEDGDYLKAKTRSQWDFVSMQLTRIATSILRGAGYNVRVVNQGRLKSTMVSLIHKRLEARANYVKKPFYEVKFRDENGHLYARVVKKDDEAKLKEIRHQTKEDATAEQAKYQTSGVNEVKRVGKKTAPKTLIDLSRLDALLSKKGYSSKLIQTTYQTLYEKQYVSYPRTDDKAITKNQFDELVTNRDALAKLVGIDAGLLTHLEPRPKLIDEAVTHGANRPGPKVPASLDELAAAVKDNQGDCAKDIYRLLAKSALAILGEDYEYEEVTGEVADHPEFITRFKQPVKLGYQLIYHEGELPKKQKPLGATAKPEVTEGANPKPSEPTKLWLFKQLSSVGKYGIGTGATQQSTMADLTNKSGHYLITDTRGKLGLTETGKFAALIANGSYIASPSITVQLFEGMDGIRAFKQQPKRVLYTVNDVVNDALKTFPKNVALVKEKVPLTEKNRAKQFAKKDRVPITYEGKEYQFNRDWGEHHFNDDELASLEKGESITFRYKGRDMTGKLGLKTYKGGKPFLTFKPDFAED